MLLFDFDFGVRFTELLKCDETRHNEQLVQASKLKLFSLDIL